MIFKNFLNLKCVYMNRGREIYETTKEMIRKLQLRDISHYTALMWFFWLMAITVLIGIYIYYRTQVVKETTDLNTMTATLATIPVTMAGINNVDAQFQYKLRDYYVASSYNSCCPGDFLDDYVSLEALTQVIKRGARLLDFEIYSYQGDVIVAAGPSDNYHFKGTYNGIPIGEAFDTVNRYAFSGGAPNQHDPLFLHLRIKSNIQDVFFQVANALTANFNNLLSQADSKYAYEAHGENFTKEPLLNFQNKVIIICDNAGNGFRGTPLDELVNLTSNSQFFRGVRSYDVEFTPDMNDLIEFNKKNMSLVQPDLSALNKNQNAALQQKYGCQMTCMNYQNMDTNLEYYLKFFANSAFVLKPKALRYVPVTFTRPPPQDPQLSYAPRPINMPQFQGNI